MTDPGYNIRLRSSARTSVGQVRENNEDNIHLWTGEHYVLAVVADGMGGAAAGEEASRLAVEAIQTGLAMRENNRRDSWDKAPENILNDKMRAVIEDANLSIIERAASEPEMRGMGTTVTMALVRDTDVVVAHVGDSRAYLVNGFDSQITQITSDHSFVEALLAAGHITREQAEEHPMRNVLYRALGQTEDLDVDLYHTRMQIGDRLVLCSDGLTRHVKPNEIALIALADENPDVASQSMIDLANARGGEDNVSVIVIAVESENPYQTPLVDVNFASDSGEDDTMVLKNLPRRINKKRTTDKDNRPKNELHRASTPESSISESGGQDVDSFSKQKMKAERLSDDFMINHSEAGRPDDIQLPDLDRTIQVRSSESESEQQPAVYESQKILSGLHRSDDDGEGHDTLMPDQ